MSDTRNRPQHAALLAAYLRGRLRPGQSMRAFCQEHGIDNQRVSAWEQNGGDVSIPIMRDLAESLGLTLGQILVVAGYGTPDDFGGAEPPEPTVPVVDVDFAIENDPTLSEAERGVLRSVRAFATGQTEQKLDTLTLRRRVPMPPQSTTKPPRRRK